MKSIFTSFFTMNADMQSQLICSGCRSILLYPRGATNVCCAFCNTVSQVPPPGMGMTQLICGGCRTLLMYACGATSVRCSCCNTVNLATDGQCKVSSPGKQTKCHRDYTIHFDKPNSCRRESHVC
ncbi:protein LOL1-like isoform X3 [Hibiscus syriacus]|uniref:protein LOL1-like isoform X3 n=1 Tax=Hibiscus syriacus TaxID=106335 RepID=UPI0019238CB1|nr:protein LOL1-like isoform X3 [Hibiscus syriacus]